MRKSQQKNLTQKQIDKIIYKHVLNKGVWVIRNLNEYEMIHYPRAFCHIDEENREVIVIDNMGTQVARLELSWFNITWNYDKRHLIKQCKYNNFQWGVNKED